MLDVANLDNGLWMIFGFYYFVTKNNLHPVLADALQHHIDKGREYSFESFVGVSCNFLTGTKQKNNSFGTFFFSNKMSMKPSNNIWIRRQQCPCGDWKCYIKYEGDDQSSVNSQLVKSETTASSSSSSEAVFTPYEIIDNVTQWYVSQFSNVHNHELLEDDQVRLLPAYRKIQEADQERILLLSKAGFPVNRIVKVLELEKGVQPGQLPFIEKDVRNFVRTCKKTVQENDALLSEKRENDMMELVEACKAMVERDPDFLYDCTTDENGKVENIAWTFGDSVRAYTVFGDVVTFDTTYRSITYGLLLGVWFGIDSHGKAIFFGSVLLQEENSHSFAWALQTFVRFMRGRRPQTILTDIDSGLRDAIARELPNTKHRVWKILSINGIFWLLAEFSQSLDSFLKRILSAHTCLQVFFEQVGIAANLQNQPRVLQSMHIKTCMPIEEHARSILTPYAFNVLQHEIVLSMEYATTEMANGSYLVRHYKKMDGEYLVIWIPDGEQIHCSCKEFEHSGMLCRHSLRVLVVKNYFELPEKYCLHRWRLESSLVPMDDQHAQSSSDECTQAFHSLAATLLTESLISKERFNYVHRELTGLLEHVRNMPVIDEFALNIAANNVSES
ncbi:hypothetical protein CMV_028138 [Castanea mollissima]|uniref:Protein FAR1-RELATED SEQUENCE n=1 Tax=Castanea mollissima TaxID=60419 RepID=A0A8J4Q9A5_9ROSI|nr:hypothetical protein CMV_028138 [Castanea mollissima]